MSTAKRFTFSFALALACSLCFVQWVHAQETITYTDEVPGQRTDWDDTLSVPQFDPADGILTGVAITVTGSVSGSVSYENLGDNEARIRLGHVVSLTVGLPNGQLISTLPTALFDEVVPGYDGTNDFDGDSGDSRVLDSSEVDSRRLETPGDLAPFVGTGDITFPALARGQANVFGPGNYEAELRAKTAGALITVRYIFLRPGIEIEKATNGIDADDASGGDVPRIAPGDPITWTYNVRNTGDITYSQSEVVVTDDQAGVTPVFDASSDSGVIGQLEPGETWRYIATGTAQTLSDPTAGTTIVPGCDPAGTGFPRPTYENIATVTAGEQQDSDPSHYCNPAQPGIEIQKSTNGADADDSNGVDVPILEPGDPVTWVYTVTNTGAVPLALADISVTDSQPGVTPVFDPSSDSGLIGVLEPGESWRYIATGTALALTTPPADVDVVPGCAPGEGDVQRSAYENVGVVAVNGLQDFDPSHYCNPAAPDVAIQKLTNGADADGPNDDDVPILEPGDAVSWQYIVTNTGNVPLTQDDLTVTDDQLGVTPVFNTESDDGDRVLSPGESWIYEATGTALALRTTTESVTTVPGCNPDGTGRERPTYENIGSVVLGEITRSDPSHYCNPIAPGIDIEKSTNGSDADDPNGDDVPIIAPGEPVVWEYIVTNTGEVVYTLDEVSVLDDQPGVTPQFVEGSDPNNNGLLEPGESWTYRATGTALSLSNVAVDINVAPGCDPNGTGLTRTAYQNLSTVLVEGARDTDPSHYCNPVRPGIAIEKLTNGANADEPNDADVPIIAPGATVTWTYVVINTGNVVFTPDEISVTDSQPGVTPVYDPSSDPNGNDLLEPGEAWRYVATGVAVALNSPPAGVTVVQGCDVTETDNSRATYQNVGRVVVEGDDDEDASHYCNPAAPAITLQKFTNGADANDPEGDDVPVITPGMVVTWTYIVRNTGDVAFLADEVVVTDSDASVAPVLDPQSDENGDGVLEPGEAWTYIATGTAVNLTNPDPELDIVMGCTDETSGNSANVYRNVGRVEVQALVDTDPSHYCNTGPTALNETGEPVQFSDFIFLPFVEQGNR